MRLLRYSCSVCNHRHRIKLFSEYKHCVGCNIEIILVPEFLISQRTQILFVTGGFSIGLALGRLRFFSGNAPYDVAQFFLDLLCLWLYAWIFRILYFQFQSVCVNMASDAIVSCK